VPKAQRAARPAVQPIDLTSSTAGQSVDNSSVLAVSPLGLSAQPISRGSMYDPSASKFLPTHLRRSFSLPFRHGVCLANRQYRAHGTLTIQTAGDLDDGITNFAKM
jgi:hypothetical protein